MDLQNDLKRIWTWLIVSLFLLSFYYLSYRYPLKYNSSETSPTYSDTPLAFQFGKYAIFALLIYLFILILSMKKTKFLFLKHEIFELVLILFIVMIPLTQSIISKNFSLLSTGIFFGVLIIYYFFPFRSLNYRLIEKTISIFIILAIVVQFYQYFNFRMFGRLPALAYEGTISVRFGSIWDDPNSFSIIMSFLFIFIWKSDYKKIFKFLICFGLVISTVLTQSLTGVIAFVVSILIGNLILLFADRKKKRLITIVKFSILIILTFVIFELFIKNSYFWNLYMVSKQGSFTGHYVGLNAFVNNVNLTNLLGFNANPLGFYAESGYINLLLNYGILYLLSFILLGVISILRLAKFIRANADKNNANIFYASFFYVLSFYISMFNLPVDTIFPLNLILVICIILSHMSSLVGNRKVSVK